MMNNHQTNFFDIQMDLRKIFLEEVEDFRLVELITKKLAFEHFDAKEVFNFFSSVEERQKLGHCCEVAVELCKLLDHPVSPQLNELLNLLIQWLNSVDNLNEVCFNPDVAEMIKTLYNPDNKWKVVSIFKASDFRFQFSYAIKDLNSFIKKKDS